MDRSPARRSDAPLSFLMLGQRVRIDCVDAPLRELVQRNFAAMTVSDDDLPADLSYRIELREKLPWLAPMGKDEPGRECANRGDLVYQLEHDLTVALQQRRPDLLFLHSAALERHGRACLLAAESGSGKSMTTWALLHHGFRYLSDELSPVDPETLTVWPYPHAISLKLPPPDPYPLPDEAIHLGRTIHVPTRFLPEPAHSRSLPLGVVFLIERRAGLADPSVRRLSPAEAGARLYVNALNALAHPGHGLDVVVRIAERTPCFTVGSGELAETCALIAATVERVSAEDTSAAT